MEWSRLYTILALLFMVYVMYRTWTKNFDRMRQRQLAKQRERDRGGRVGMFTNLPIPTVTRTLDALHDGALCATCDGEGRIVLANALLARTLQYPDVDTLVGKSIFAQIVSDPSFKETFTNSGIWFGTITHVRRDDNSKLPVSCVAVPVTYSASGRASRASRDIGDFIIIGREMAK